VPKPTGIQQLENLGQDVLALMIRHDQLRPLIHSIITEQELDIEKFSEAEWQRSAKIYRQRHQLSTAEDVKQHCQKHGFNQSQFQWQVRLQDCILKTSKKRFSNKAELHYLTRKEQFDRIAYSQLITKDEHLAQELYLRVNEDEAKFADLAIELTSNSDLKFQWQVGPIPMARVPKPLSKPLQGSRPGTLLEPIRLQNNWAVVRLEQYQPTEFDEAMEQRMCLELFQQHVNQLVDKQIETISADLSSEATTTAS